jgi:hypothetical protein
MQRSANCSTGHLDQEIVDVGRGDDARDLLESERHVKRTLSSYFTYYHESRTHLGLDKQCPHVRQVSSVGTIVQIPHLGGLHHRYERTAA